MIGWVQRKVERKMATQVIGGIVRAALAMAGGSLLDESQTEQAIGALAVLATIAWSAWQKYQAQRATK